MRSQIEVVLKLIDQVTPKIREIKKELSSLANTLNKSLKIEATTTGLHNEVKRLTNELRVLYNEIQAKVSKFRVNLLLSLDKEDATRITSQVKTEIEKINRQLERLSGLKLSITDPQDLARLTTEERKLKNLRTTLEKIANIDAFKNFYRASAREFIEQIRRLRAELREVSASPEGVNLQPFEEKLKKIREQARTLLREFETLPSLARRHPLVEKAYSQIQRNLANLEAHFSRVKEKVEIANNSFRRFWQEIGYMGIGFTVVFEAFYRAEEAIGSFVEKVKSALGLLDDLNTNLVKLATFYNFFGTNTSKPIRQTYENLRSLGREIQLLGAYSSASLDDLLQGIDELAQHSVFLSKELIPAFANFSDFIATIATTTGSSALQVRQELQALFEGTARAGNTLVRFVKRLEEIGRLPRGTLEALQNATLPIQQFRIILSAVAKEWYEAQQFMFEISGRNAYNRLNNVLTILIQNASKLFNLFKTGQENVSAFAQTWNSLLARIINLDALNRSAEAYKRFLDNLIKEYSNALKAGLSDNEAYKLAFEKAKRFYEEFIRLREEAFKTSAVREFEAFTFQLLQLGQNLIALFTNIASAAIPVLTRVLGVVNALIGTLANSKYTTIATQIIAVAVSFKLLAGAIRFVIDGLKLAIVYLSRFLGLSALAQLTQLRFSLTAIAASFALIARSIGLALLRVTAIAGGFILVKSAIDYVIDRLEAFKLYLYKTVLISKAKLLELEIGFKRLFAIDTRNLEAELQKVNARIADITNRIKEVKSHSGKSFTEYIKTNLRQTAEFVKKVWEAVFNPEKEIDKLSLKLDNRLKELPKGELPIDIKLPPSDNLITRLKSLISELQSITQNAIRLGINIEGIDTLRSQIVELYTKLENALKEKLSSLPKGSLDWLETFAQYIQVKLDQIRFKAGETAQSIKNALNKIKTTVLTGNINISLRPLLSQIEKNALPSDIKKQISSNIGDLVNTIANTVSERLKAIKARISVGIAVKNGEVEALINNLKARIAELQNSKIDIEVKVEAIKKLRAILGELYAVKLGFAQFRNLSLKLKLQIEKGEIPGFTKLLGGLKERVHKIAINPYIPDEVKVRLYQQATSLINQLTATIGNIKFDFSNWRTADQAYEKLQRLQAIIPQLSNQIASMDLPPLLKEEALLRLELIRQKLSQIREQLQQQTAGWRAFFEPFIQYTSRIKQQIDITKAYAQAGASMFNAFVSSLAQSFQALITGQGNALKRFIASLWQAMLSILTQLIAKILIIKAIGFLAPGLLPILGLAEGGILKGGFTPIAKFAEGGLITRPTLGVIGEAGYPEAVIPLKSGYVPVKIQRENAKSKQTEQQPPQINIVNVVSPDLVYEALNTAEGREIILNIIRSEMG